MLRRLRASASAALKAPRNTRGTQIITTMAEINQQFKSCSLVYIFFVILLRISNPSNLNQSYCSKERKFIAESLYQKTQCAPGFSFPTQKVHGIFHFNIAGMYKTDQNQLKKTSVIRLPKFTSIDMVKKCNPCLSFSIENPFFEDYCFGSLMTDGFFN